MKQYRVTGMGCEACVKRVEKAVLSLEGVKTAAVDLSKQTLSVDGDDIKADAVKSAVLEAGYGIEEL